MVGGHCLRWAGFIVLLLGVVMRTVITTSVRVPAGTVVVRLVVFPIMVKGQREAAKLNNIMPDMVRLNNKMSEAKQSGNKFECKFRLPLLTCVQMLVWSPTVRTTVYEYYVCRCAVAKAYSELEMCQKKHGVNSLKTFLVPFVQVSVWLSLVRASESGLVQKLLTVSQKIL